MVESHSVNGPSPQRFSVKSVPKNLYKKFFFDILEWWANKIAVKNPPF